jgi:phosphoribosylanthranilate isomerase
VALRVKICGITNEADGRAVAELGADAIGVNFYERSPRFVDIATAQAIVNRLPPFVEPVGVFAEVSPETILQDLQPLSEIRTIQWHGAKPRPNEYPGYRVIPVFSIGEASHLVEIERYLAGCKELGQLPSAVMVDARVAGQYGGTGKTVPWALLANFRPGIPLILAGGLTPENVAEAIRIVRPYAVDVASGVESSPGVKDIAKVSRFIGNAREAAAKYMSLEANRD